MASIGNAMVHGLSANMAVRSGDDGSSRFMGGMCFAAAIGVYLAALHGCRPAFGLLGS
jgi:hypothetical protein